MKLSFRQKLLIVLIGFIAFWFFLFYPIILPYMNLINIYPLLATILYESLFYLTMLVATLMILGEKRQKHGFKWSFIAFALYHIFDSVEPPSILTPTGQFILSPSAIISWDYGIGYSLHQLGLSGSLLYYVTNIGFILLLAVIVFFLISPQTLGKIVREVLDG